MEWISMCLCHYIHEQNSKEPHTFIQPKYTVAARLNTLNLSIGRIKEKYVPKINFTELKPSSPRIIPPHV